MEHERDRILRDAFVGVGALICKRFEPAVYAGSHQIARDQEEELNTLACMSKESNPKRLSLPKDDEMTKNRAIEMKAHD